MSRQDIPIFGIDLGTTYSCIAYVDELGQPVVVPNAEGQLITPSVVLFEGDTRVVGEQAKNTAVLYHDRVVQMVKRSMGSPDWRFLYEGIDYSPEEVSSFILRKLVQDASDQRGYPITDVVITCPAYFGIAQREATARAGEIAGLNVLEIINEPTAAAIDYGLHTDQDQVVLVYDLGGGTFDITIIEIKDGSITVVATGGDHELGGRDWDQQIVQYLAQQWMDQTGSFDNPIDSPETLQELWEKAEKVKKALTARNEVTESMMYNGLRTPIKLTREKFDELTRDKLARTLQLMRETLAIASQRGYDHFDQLLLVGGSTRMPQVREHLLREFPNIEPRMHDPDQAVAKGAAVYGQKLSIGRKIQIKIAELTGVQPEDVDLTLVNTATVERAQEEVAIEGGYRLPAVRKMVEQKVTNVSSHSFGIIALDRKTDAEVITNLVLTNEPLPRTNTRTFNTRDHHQELVALRIMETTTTAERVDDLGEGIQIGEAILDIEELALPKDAPIEVTFELNQQGRLYVIGREPSSGRIVEATIETASGISSAELEEAKSRSRQVVIS
jgi:molecular chaperone DnaK